MAQQEAKDRNAHPYTCHLVVANTTHPPTNQMSLYGQLMRVSQKEMFLHNNDTRDTKLDHSKVKMFSLM